MSNNFKLSSVSQYFAWLLQQYQELQQKREQKDAYRIVNIENDKYGNCKLAVQIIGKTTTFKTTAEKIARDDAMLNLFSRQDVRTITYLACEEIKQPKLRVLVQEFCEKLNKMIFHVKKKGSEDIVKKTATELSMDKESISSMSSKDAHMIGYMAGSENILEENAAKEKAKNKTNN